jgi:hypothetical protein
MLGARIGAAMLALVVIRAPVAHADNLDFQSPAGNIGCSLMLIPGGSSAQCDIGDRDWVLPNCPQNRPVSLTLGSAKGPEVYCHKVGSLLAPGVPALGYGQTRSAGVISCSSESSRVRCTNSATGHFFSVSRESYQTG